MTPFFLIDPVLAIEQKKASFSAGVSSVQKIKAIRGFKQTLEKVLVYLQQKHFRMKQMYMLDAI